MLDPDHFRDVLSSLGTSHKTAPGAAFLL